MPRVERPQMTDYGVPTDPEGALPWSWAQERLVRCRNYWVVTASAGGRPHAMPVWGVWLPDHDRFGFSCAPQARKARNLRDNPQMSVAVDDTVECVSIEGLAREVSGEDCEAMIQAYAHKYEPDPDRRAALADFIRPHAIFEMTPTKGFGIIEREEEFAARATRWVW